MEPAHRHLEATLEPHRARGWRRLTHVGGILLAVVTGDIPSLSDLVVRRRDTGAVVLRTKADVGDPERLLAQVQRDLREKTVTEFAAEWRLPAAER